jgi:hypothetical protein
MLFIKRKKKEPEADKNTFHKIRDKKRKKKFIQEKKKKKGNNINIIGLLPKFEVLDGGSVLITFFFGGGGCCNVFPGRSFPSWAVLTPPVCSFC